MKGMSKKSSNGGGCLLGLFSIGVMVFFLIFLAATIFFFVGPEAIFGTDCTQGSKTTLINDLYTTSVDAYKSLCVTCPCKIQDQNSALYKLVSATGKLDPVNGFEKYGDCLNIPSTVANVEIMAALENLLGCAGWCPLSQDAPTFGAYTYRFRNINDCSSLCISLLK
jgi:hypothetical protein